MKPIQFIYLAIFVPVAWVIAVFAILVAIAGVNAVPTNDIRTCGSICYKSQPNCPPVDSY